jgi:hypothetical protein
MMRNILVAWSMLLVTPMSAMKRLRDNDKKNRHVKKICLEHTQQFIPEIDRFIIDIAIKNEHKLRPCIQTIKSFFLTNKQSYGSFDNQKYSDELIEKLSKKFCCPHEIVAKNLYTPQAKNRLCLQNELFSLCSENNFADNATEEFKQLIEKGVNVDFTYNYDNQPQTLLMIHCDKLTCITYEKKHPSYFYLLTKKANFNQQTSQNKTLLMMAVKFPIAPHFSEIIIKHKKININEQNNRGETALLYCIKNRKKHRMSNVFVRTIEKLLKNGANPLLADNNGNTPLSATYDIPDLSEMRDIVIELLRKSIAEHQATNPQ